jgi:excisionase family DNA binding protein
MKPTILTLVGDSTPDTPLTAEQASQAKPANDNGAISADDAPEVMTADEVAAFLRCSRKSVYDAVARHEIPHQKLGRKILFSRAALLDWLACKGPSERNQT